MSCWFCGVQRAPVGGFLVRLERGGESGAGGGDGLRGVAGRWPGSWPTAALAVAGAGGRGRAAGPLARVLAGDAGPGLAGDLAVRGLAAVRRLAVRRGGRRGERRGHGGRGVHRGRGRRAAGAAAGGAAARARARARRRTARGPGPAGPGRPGRRRPGPGRRACGGGAKPGGGRRPGPAARGCASSATSPPKFRSSASSPPSKPWPTAAKRHTSLR